MHINDLHSQNFDAYFRDAHDGDPLWLFVHVPKTAGSSLNGELSTIMSPAHHIFIDYSKLDAAQAARTYDELFDQSVDSFIAAAQTRRFRFCTGHIKASHVQRIMEQVPDTRPMTLLRDPVARFVSDFRYQRSPMHPGHEQFAQQNPTIEHYIGLQGDWNKFATSLLPFELRESADMAACADWMLRTYKFIGAQEMYALSLHAMSWFAGVPRRPHVRRRINTPTPETEVLLTPSLEAEIRDRNALDVALYEALAPRFNNVSATLAAYLNRVAPRPR